MSVEGMEYDTIVQNGPKKVSFINFFININSQYWVLHFSHGMCRAVSIEGGEVL